MQILRRTSTHIVVELTHHESALIGSSLHLYHGTNELYHKPIPPGTLELANAFLWQGVVAGMEARANARWFVRGWNWLRTRLSRLWGSKEPLDPKHGQGNDPSPNANDTHRPPNDSSARD